MRQVIDYKSPSVVDDVVAAVKKVGGNFVGTYDTISTNDTYAFTVPVTEKLGGGSLPYVAIGTPPEVSGNIKVGAVFGINDLTHPVWSDFVTKALESRQLKPAPEPLTIGKGLESLQTGLAESKKGVSARKVIVEI